MQTKLSLTIDDANAMMAASLDAARSVGRTVSIAIVDDAGGLLAFQRMDGARAHTIDLAQRKARASALVGVATALIEASNRERPPQAPDMAVGADAIGVSGGRTEEGETIARAGLGAIATT